MKSRRSSSFSGFFLSIMVHVGAVVIDLDILGMEILTCLVVRENDIGLHALGVEGARGEAQDRMYIRGFDQLLTTHSQLLFATHLIEVPLN